MSRAQNKQRKKEAKLAIEMKELEASENQQDRLHYNSQTIEAIFGIYFRVLKGIGLSQLYQELKTWKFTTIESKTIFKPKSCFSQ